MKTSRIDIDKANATGLSLGDSISITQIGTIKSLETYDMCCGPTVADEKKAKKESPKVTLTLEVAKTEIDKTSTKKTPKQAFDKAFEESGKQKADKGEE